MVTATKRLVLNSGVYFFKLIYIWISWILKNQEKVLLFWILRFMGFNFESSLRMVMDIKNDKKQNFTVFNTGKHLTYIKS